MVAAIQAPDYAGKRYVEGALILGPFIESCRSKLANVLLCSGAGRGQRHGHH